MKPISQQHRAHCCAADREKTRAHNLPAPVLTPLWEMHVGYIKLYINGPENEQWFPVSRSYYTGQVGTFYERSIARRVILILNSEHRTDANMDAAGIERLIRRAKKEMAADHAARKAAVPPLLTVS